MALEFLRSDVLEDEEHKARFLREAQAAASLIHSNICVIHEIDESEGAPFIAMELVEGETVKQRSRPGRPSWTKRLTLPFKLQLDCKRRTKKELFTVTSRART